MTPVRLAAIDVGTNSVKLLVLEVGPALQPVLESGIQTRLGEGFYPDRVLQPQAVARTAEAVSRLVERARRAGAQRIRLFATSAAREAVNRHELVRAIQAVSGLPVEIISGTQEAEWAYQGVRSHPELARVPLAVVEVGGGSTQLLLGQGPHVYYRASLPLGAVRLWELESVADPPTPADLDRLRRRVRETLHGHLDPAVREAFRDTGHLLTEGPPVTVAVGGTALTLARIELKAASWDREQMENLRLSPAQLTALVETLWSLPLAQRRTLPGLPRERADIILTGSVIYEQLGEQLGVSQWRFSTRGLRYGALLSLLEESAAGPNTPARPTTRPSREPGTADSQAARPTGAT